MSQESECVVTNITPSPSPDLLENSDHLRSMFEYKRIPDKLAFYQYVLLVMYLPFGLIIGSLRFVLFFTFAIPVMKLFFWVGKENLYWKTIGYLFGLFSKFCEIPVSSDSVVRELTSLSDSQIIVCNHSSDFDGIAMIPLLRTSNMILLTSSFLGPLVKWANFFGWDLKIVIRETEPSKKYITKKKLLELMDAHRERKLVLFAEGATTNGKVGLLQYNQFGFSLDRPIQPLALKINCHLPINIDLNGKNLFPNLFFFCFCPFITFRYYILPAQVCGKNEKPDEFAKRVQDLTASFLKISSTTYTYKHKNKLYNFIR